MTFKKYKEEVMSDIRSEKISFKVDGRKYYVYRVTDIINNVYYYGSRNSLKDDLDEDFWKYCTTSKRKKEIIDNKEKFRVKILKVFDNSGDKIIYEAFLHKKFNVKNNNKFWNEANQTPFGRDTSNKSVFLLNGEKVFMDSDKARESGLVSYNSGRNHINFGKTREEHSLKMRGENNPSANFRELNVINFKTGEEFLITRKEYYMDNFKFSKNEIKRLENGFIVRFWSIFNQNEALQKYQELEQKRKHANKITASKNSERFKMKKNQKYQEIIGKTIWCFSIDSNEYFKLNEENIQNYTLNFILQVLSKERVYHKKTIFAFSEEELIEKVEEFFIPKSQPYKARNGCDNPKAKKFRIYRGDEEFFAFGNLKEILNNNNINSRFKEINGKLINSQGFIKEEIYE